MSDFLTRDEFEVFERNTTRSFDELRSSIGIVGRKLDEMSNRGTDWKAVFAGGSFLLAIVTVVGGLVAFGLNVRMDANAAAIEKIERLQREHESLPGHPVLMERVNVLRESRP